MRSMYTSGVALAALLITATVVLWAASPSGANAHCQVPCGIYDDPARIKQLLEDATTIEKAVKNINELAGAHEAQSVNQAVRWINTKEDHASHIIEVVSNYFLAQKVKPVASGAEGYQAYLENLADHHAVIVAAMKTKQNADTKFVDALKAAIDQLDTHYK